MTRFGTLVTSTVVAALMGIAPEASGQVRSALARADLAPIAAALHGSVEGVVIDDAGAPISGASVTVSAVGSMSALALSDRTGRFHLYGLPPGAYLVRVHSAGYIASRTSRQFVEVRPSVRTTISVLLHRADRGRVVAAGLGPTSSGGEDAQVSDDHSDVAWYLRHLPRSVLKDTSDRGASGGETTEAADSPKPASSFAPPASRFASTLFNDLPFSGQVNLLTTSSFDAVDRLFSADSLSHSVASLSVGGPVGAWGDWAIQGLTTQGDLGTWFLSGVLKSRAAGSHVYDLNVAYSTQRFRAPAPLEFPTSAGASESTRSVGSFYAADRWQVSPQMSLGYGAAYARYDYLAGPGLFSPRADLTLRPGGHFIVRTSISSHALAPGAEGFVPSMAAGLWVPAERTFAWVSQTPLTAEHANNYELLVQRDFSGYTITARTFYQEVSHQLVALFGRPDNPTPAAAPYAVSSLGDVDAKGWSASLSNTVNSHLRGTITYQMTTASWVALNEGGLLNVFAPTAVRERVTRVHDVTTCVDAELPRSATRVFVLYKINTAFAKVNADEARPGLDARFDVQVTQPLPLLDFTSAQWQVVFAVRNLFREAAPGASVFDELLVVRPPKRLVGGLVVRF